MTIISTSAAAFIMADSETPNKRPGSKAGLLIKRLYWDDATQEQRDTHTWICSGDRTYTILPLTEEEEQERWLDRQYHMRQMINYILENFGIAVYNEVITSYKDEFEKYNVKIDNDFPHCKYAAGQCDLFCKYYKRGGCCYEEVLDAVVTAM